MAGFDAKRFRRFLLTNATVAMFLAVIGYFGLVTPGYVSAENFANIVKQSSFVGIAAIGMTFVLLTAGIDLSVGSVMYLAPVIAGFAMGEYGVGVAGGLAIALAAGTLMGALNAFLIVRLRIAAFIVTLSTLFLFRGAGTFLTSSQALDFPRELLDFGLSSPLGIPLPIVVFALLALAAHLVLAHTPFGRQIYAVGNDPNAARKAGIEVGRVLASVYVISSACAALAGFVLIAQIGRLDQAFGENREFDVIAAAVLGGTSLFGGAGSAINAVFGATFVQAVTTGMIFERVNLYMQPIVLGAIIFAAVLIDSRRRAALQRARRRFIRVEDKAETTSATTAGSDEAGTSLVGTK